MKKEDDKLSLLTSHCINWAHNGWKEAKQEKSSKTNKLQLLTVFVFWNWTEIAPGKKFNVV